MRDRCKALDVGPNSWDKCHYPLKTFDQNQNPTNAKTIIKHRSSITLYETAHMQIGKNVVDNVIHVILIANHWQLNKTFLSQQYNSWSLVEIQIEMLTVETFPVRIRSNALDLHFE